ncbi:WGxxGxxG family protein [Leptolyngbya ohadii]|uniref:WGxxGxxG family protein n=1 Tax=Leptolyngbya ohadii TaxID=1962290 RepID=UPI000B59E9C7|nr:WGxxGxxG family protein [Leptolyngbya ohadii]
MKLSKMIGASALALSLSVLPATIASATTTTGTTDTTTTTDTTAVPNTTADTTPAADVESNDGFDWGWLGLLGLIGLAGLAGKKRDDQAVHYREPDVTTRTGYRE